MEQPASPATTPADEPQELTASARVLLRRVADYEPDGAPSGTATLPSPRTDEAVPLVTRQPGSGVARVPSRAELHRLVRAVLEVLDGKRPVAQLKRYLGETCYEALRTRATTEAGRRDHHRLSRLYLSRPAARSIELCATVEVGGRLLAAAGNVEIARHGWRCTSLRFL